MKPKLLVLVFFIFCVSILCADVYQVSGNISTNTVWTAGDWYVLTGTVKVLDGANLYIEHGVKVLFNTDTSLEIEGSLTAVGSAGSYITFEPSAYSMFPDRRYTNILFYGAESSSLSYCNINGSAHNEGILRIINTSSTISLNHCNLNNAESGNGMYIYNGSATVNVNNSAINTVGYNGIYAYGSNVSVNIDNLSVSGCETAINMHEWQSPSLSVEDLSVYNPRSYITVCRLYHYQNFQNLYVSNPTVNMLYVHGTNSMYSDLTLPDLGRPYRIKNYIGLYNSTIFTIESGVEFAFEQYGQIELNGSSSVEAFGTSSQPISFSTINSSTTWGGFIFNQGTSGSFAYCNFIRAGNPNEYGHWKPTIDMTRGTNLSLSNCSLSGGNSYVINISGSEASSLSLVDVSLSGAAVAGINCTNTALAFTYSNLSISGCGVPLRIVANLVESLDNQPIFNSNTDNRIVIHTDGNYYRHTTFRNWGFPYKCEVSLTAQYVNTIIEAGVNMHFGDQLSYNINGTINVNGTSDDPVVFRNYPESSTPWMGFYLPASCSYARFKYSNFDYAASPQYGNRNVIYIYRADQVILEDCNITNAAGTGIYTESAHTGDSLTISNLNIDGCASDGIYLASQDQVLSINGLTISNCGWYPLTLSQRWVHCLQDLSLNDNANNLIRLIYGTGMVTQTLLNHGYPYLVSGSALNVDYGQTVTMQPGIMIYLENELSMNVYGSLIAEGTSSNPITFSRRPGTTTYWQSINLTNHSNAIFDHCVFSYGGKDYPYGDIALIQDLGASTFTIRNSSISHTQESAIRITDKTATDQASIFNLEIDDCSLDGLYVLSATHVMEIDSISISNCGRYPISMPFRFVQDTEDLILANNAKQLIRIIASASLYQNLAVPNFGYPYQMETHVYLNQGYQMNIAPGTVFWMSGEIRFEYSGKLYAPGTLVSPIVFTRIPGTTSFWEGMRFLSSCPEANLAFCTIDYAGYNQYEHSRYAILNNSATAVSLSHCTISNSYGHGILASDMSSTDTFSVSDCQINQVGLNGFTTDTNNYNLSVSNLDITNGNGYPIYTKADLVDRFTGILSSGFTNQYFAVNGTIITHNATWLDHGMPYLILNYIDVNDAKTLNISAGVQMVFADYVMYQKSPMFRVYGALNFNGTQENPILLSGLNPESLSTWNGIRYINPDATCTMSYTTIKNAGLDEQHTPADEQCLLYLSGGTLNISNCSFGNSSYHLLKVDTNGTLNITDCKLRNAVMNGIWQAGGNINILRSEIYECASNGIYYAAGNLALGTSAPQWNKIHTNGKNIYNNTATPLSAKYTWWGSVNQDSIDAYLYDNEEGKGEIVFEPWYDQSVSQLYYHVLDSPTGLVLTLLDESNLRLVWSPVPTATHYEIEWAESPDALEWFSLASNIGTESYDIPLELYQKRFFRIIAKK